MRSGYYKERFEQLVALTDSSAVKTWTILLLVGMVVAPLTVGPYLTSHLTLILMTLIGALGLNILTGLTGLISLGHVAFLMLGAYGYAIGVSRLGLHPLMALGLAGMVPAVAGLVVGVPSLRLKGLYLAITTLAFSFIVSAAVLAGGGVDRRTARPDGRASPNYRNRLRIGSGLLLGMLGHRGVDRRGQS